MGTFSFSKIVVSTLSAVVASGGMALGEDLKSFAVLAGSTVTNTGPSVINGNIGLSPGTAVVGFFAPGVVTAPYTIHANDGVAIQAQIDLTSQYNDLANRPATVNLTGQNLAGLTLAPGVYNYDTSAQLSGTLTLDAQNNPNAVFVVNIGSTLITSSAASVALVNGAQGANVYFVVGSSATLGSATTLAGNILALTSITLNTGATINCGAALARNGAVTLDTNTISVCTLATTPIASVVTPVAGGTPVTGGTPAPAVSPTRAATANELAVARAIDAFVVSGGRAPLVFSLLTPAQLLEVLNRLTGEVGTSVGPAGRELMSGFLTQVFDRVAGDQGPFADNRGPVAPRENDQLIPASERFDAGRPAGPSQTVRALGYGPEDAAPLRAMESMAQIDVMAPIVQPVDRPWNAWIAGYGAQTRTDGNARIGAHDRSVDTAGFAGGVDYLVDPDKMIGFAIGAGQANFDLAGGNGYGNIDTVQASVYGRVNFDAAYLAAVVGVGYGDVSTERSLTFATTERYTADFSTYDVAGQIEAGYRIDIPDLVPLTGSGWVTPYAALQVQTFFIPSYSEDRSSNAALFALSYDSSATTSTRSELGARFGRSIPLDGSVLTLRSRLAWAHDAGKDASADVSFRTLPGTTFRVEGAEADGDFLLASAGAEVRFANGFGIGGFFDSEISENSQTFSETGRLSFAW